MTKSACKKPDIREIFSSDMLEILIPTGIFCDRNYSALESLTIYLRHEYLLSLSEIATILNRSRKTIWTTYHRGSVKDPSIDEAQNNMFIPVSVLSDRSLSMLESIIRHLALTKSNTQIATLLNRSDKTIWTVKSRISKKWQSG